MNTKEDNIPMHIAEIFKELVIELDFQQITITMIAEQINISRPTFYNYFKDKFEIFEYILQKELFDSIKNLISLGLVS